MTAPAGKRRLWIIPALALAIGAAAIPALWFGGRFWALSAIDDWRALERDAGREWTCVDPVVSGFPFRLSYLCPQPSLRATRAGGGVSGAATSLQLDATLLRPMTVRAHLTGPLALQRPDGSSLSVDWTQLQIDLRFGLNGLKRVSALGGGLDATYDNAQSIARRIGADSLSLDASGLDSDAVDLRGAARNVDAPDVARLTGSRDLIAGNLAMRLNRANLIDLADLPMSLEQWRRASGSLDISNLSASQGQMSATVDGSLRVDERHRTQGALNVAATGIEPILKRFGVSPAALSISGALGGLFGQKPNPSQPAATLKLPLALREGQVFVGPFRAPVVLTPLY